MIFHSVLAFENMEINKTLLLISIQDLTGNALEEEQRVRSWTEACPLNQVEQNYTRDCRIQKWKWPHPLQFCQQKLWVCPSTFMGFFNEMLSIHNCQLVRYWVRGLTVVLKNFFTFRTVTFSLLRGQHTAYHTFFLADLYKPWVICRFYYLISSPMLYHPTTSLHNWEVMSIKLSIIKRCTNKTLLNSFRPEL